MDLMLWGKSCRTDGFLSPMLRFQICGIIWTTLNERMLWVFLDQSENLNE